MNSACMDRLVRRSLLWGLCAIGPLAAHGAVAAEGPYDGTYSGKATVTFGTASVCGSDGVASVTVRDSEIEYGFGAFPLKMAVAHDGRFSGRARKGNRGGGQVMRASGRISKSDLVAGFTVNGVHGRVCAYHWALSKT